MLKLAMNVGSFALAEHYLCALLANAVIYGKRDVILKVNEVREFYGVPKIPEAGNGMSRTNSRPSDSLDDKARAAFKKMLEIWDANPPAVMLYSNAVFFGKAKNVDWTPYGCQFMDFGPDNVKAK